MVVEKTKSAPSTSHNHVPKSVFFQVKHNEHELWDSGCEAAESARLWDTCLKNPGHTIFISVGEFSIYHLPVAYQREDYVQYLKVWCDLTVRLRVGCTSSARPADGGNYRPGSGGQRVGTGYVLGLHPKTDQQSWTFYIATAKHVAFDDQEVAMTFVDFFFDYLGSREDGTVKTLRGSKVEATEDDYDWCLFSCVCRDGELAAKMMARQEERNRLKVSLDDWMRSFLPWPVAIVSHPHGRPKHITLGVTRGVELDTGMCSYSTKTCPGSSGARVIGVWWAEMKYYGGHHCQGWTDGLNRGFDSF